MLQQIVFVMQKSVEYSSTWIFFFDLQWKDEQRERERKSEVKRNTKRNKDDCRKALVKLDDSSYDRENIA